jgi:hypothetical protein
LDAADEPSSANPFITRSALPAPQMTADQEAALDAAENPSVENPLITQSRLDAQLPDGAAPPAWPIGVTGDQRAALDAADQPGALNPFVTTSRLPPGPWPGEWPLGVTPAQRAALDSAYQPGADNPFATMADVALAGITMRAVAGGLVDLSRLGDGPAATFGGLEVRQVDPNGGLATLGFAAYQPAAPGSYVVKALPVAGAISEPPQGGGGGAPSSRCRAIEFVEFNQDGFVLHMCLARDDTPALGLCMVEVSEMAGNPHPLVQAVYDYYALIQKRAHAAAWPMLSPEFRASRKFTKVEEYTSDWTKSGPAIITGLMVEQVAGARATILLDLRYDKAIEGRKNVRLRYWLRNSRQEGDPGFSYLLFSEGKMLLEY